MRKWTSVIYDSDHVVSIEYGRKLANALIFGNQSPSESEVAKIEPRYQFSRLARTCVGEVCQPFVRGPRSQVSRAPCASGIGRRNDDMRQECAVKKLFHGICRLVDQLYDDGSAMRPVIGVVLPIGQFSPNAIGIGSQTMNALFFPFHCWNVRPWHGTFLLIDSAM